MHDFLTHKEFEVRLRQAVSVAWQIFARKVGGGLISINKEASMQLQYAYILRQLLPLTFQQKGERADIELETNLRTTRGTNNVDILLQGECESGTVRIAVEMKCYRTIASSGGARGAHDIFMKDIYEDLAVLEDYVSIGHVSRGVALVMNDLARFVNPRVKSGKCWAYDISHGYTFHGGRIDVPIGGKDVSIVLKKSYQFLWEKFGPMWFAEIEGRLPNSDERIPAQLAPAPFNDASLNLPRADACRTHHFRTKTD